MDSMDPIDVVDGQLPRFVVEGRERPGSVFDVVPRELEPLGETADPMAKRDALTYAWNDWVFKWFADPQRTVDRAVRSHVLYPCAPAVDCVHHGWLRYAKVPGRLLSEDTGRLVNFLDWASDNLWCTVFALAPHHAAAWVENFYYRKTMVRVRHRNAKDVTAKMNELDWDVFRWRALLSPTWHGDCSFENVVVTGLSQFRIIDWREDQIGDVYYDLAKLYKSVFFDHRTVKKDGTWKAHEKAARLVDQLRKWCGEHDYDWDHVLRVHALHVLAMAGSHDGPLGDHLFKWGTDELRRLP